MSVVIRHQPAFDTFDPRRVLQQLAALLTRQRQQLQAIEVIEHPSWSSVMEPLQAMDDELVRFWSPVRHLNAVQNNDELRVAYNDGLVQLSDWYTDLGQSTALYRHFKAIQCSAEYDTLSRAQKKIIDNAERDFRLSGVSLEGTQKERYKAISLRLSQLGSQFEDNLLDCSNAWKKSIDSASRLAGLPPSALAMAAQFARDNGQAQGWMLGLEFPLYHAVITYADDRSLREELYKAWNSRASDQGSHDKKWDNAAIMREILQLRQEKAQILGFKHYAQLSVETKMVDSPETVIEFLYDLCAKAKPQASRELADLRQFAQQHGSISALEAWDMAYYAEKQKQALYAISDEDLKLYFPAEKVIQGLFDIVQRLFAVTITVADQMSVWHPDVRYFDISDGQGKVLGGFYLDMYARAKKRGGAWMDECVARWKKPQGLQIPIAYLTCNLTPVTEELPALLTHDEVITLFHEFGHGLHHMLTTVDYPGVAGINGVEWDAVELPSQFMENWCWQSEALDMLSAHYQTGERLPSELLEKAQNAKNYQSAMQLMRQIELSMFDMQLHLLDNTQNINIREILHRVRNEVAVFCPPADNRFENSFSHIFAGGYAAGYFSYKWAEVLSADAFSRFEDEGIFNPQTGRDFLKHILQRGGTQPAKALFKAFRGREPSISALLRHAGLTP